MLAVPVMAQGLTPDEAVAKMRLPDGFTARVVAAEPLVRQPVAIEFDDRGRLWVIQYLQYPNPEGLQRVQVDRFSRTKYDRVPEPPPRGPRGADRITILEDTDGDGRMDRSRDFVDGLNLATGFAFGHGGVFVLQVPYLLFYPDRNRDDLPDSDPEVLLSGFGMEDAHSVANSLTWGPDGWLYGCQGSTVTAHIRGLEFQQGVWRYHPVTQEFELFCEGGGNAWGLDFDRTGRLLYSTNFGSHILVHGVQGAYYVKSFGKHGALQNPHAYGYFEHTPHQNFRGGHVTVGGIVYLADSFPEAYRGTYIAGDLLGHGVYWHTIQPRGSTIQTAHGGELVTTKDTWFAPTDVTVGPDGAIYVADWCDARTAHPDPDADWDRSNGRIYRISATGTRPVPAIDFAKLNVRELLALHQHRSQWYVRHAREELTRRISARTQHDRPGQGLPETDRLSLQADFQESALKHADETAALEALWSLNRIGGFNELLADELLNSPHPAVRSWTVRLLGDGKVLSPETAHRLDKFAEKEPSIDVRQQLACTAARLIARQAMPIINANINRDLDVDDPYLPLLWWWAVEKQSVTGRDEVLKRFVRPSLWKSRLGRDVLLTRLTRRYASEGTVAGLDSVTQLFKAAPDDSARRSLWPQVLLGWQEIPRDLRTPEWLEIARSHEVSRLLLADWKSTPEQMPLLQLSVAIGHPEPFALASKEAFDRQLSPPRRVALLTMLGPTGHRSLIEPALQLIAADQPDSVRIAALQILSRFDDASIASQLIALHQRHPESPLNSPLRDLLLDRRDFAKTWLTAVDRGDIPAASTPVEQIRRVALFGDPELDALVTRHWGKLQGATREEKLAEVRRLNNDLRAAGGDRVAGQALFKKLCANCHQLFGEGAKIGPDLTTANRQDRDFLLISLVDPGSVIRKEYVNVVIRTTGGRVLTGLPIARTDASITLANAKGEKQEIPTAEIEELQDSPTSLMPDNLYRQLTPQELRDLFAFLQARQ
ncbi:MAG: c-type cytochrome [Planctomycetes bacterium]|nr:c-type cytochrome [Planctomycetota bacterium]